MSQFSPPEARFTPEATDTPDDFADFGERPEDDAVDAPLAVGDLVTFTDTVGREVHGQVIQVHPDPENPAVIVSKLDTDGRYINPDDAGISRLED